MLKSCIAAGLFLVINSSYSGFYGTTTHSRANCGGFNESVTWWADHSFDWRVESHHYPNPQASRPIHVINTGRDYNWRVAAYHATEAYSSRGDQWWVNGYHFFYPYGKEKLNYMSSIGDCSLYDGWWS